MVELLIPDGIVPATEDVPLKKLMNDSLKVNTCFFNSVSLCIPSSCSSLSGSNGVSPSSPKTFKTFLAIVRIFSTLAFALTTQFYNLWLQMNKETFFLFIILYLASLE